MRIARRVFGRRHAPLTKGMKVDLRDGRAARPRSDERERLSRGADAARPDNKARRRYPRRRSRRKPPRRPPTAGPRRPPRPTRSRTWKAGTGPAATVLMKERPRHVDLLVLGALERFKPRGRPGRRARSRRPEARRTSRRPRRSAAPRPQEAQAPQVVQSRPLLPFSITFEAPRLVQFFSSTIQLRRTPQSEVREGWLLTQQGAVLVAIEHGDV